jgi:hypothetical protein
MEELHLSARAFGNSLGYFSNELRVTFGKSVAAELSSIIAVLILTVFLPEENR